MSKAQNPRAARLRRVEQQTCPRRMNDMGPWEYKEGLDWWVRGTWAATQQEADAEVADFMAAHPRGGIGNVLWLYPGEQPRTCSFCGGAHPDDIVALLRAGWEVEGTSKSYKRYLEPPGHRRYMDEIMAHRGTADGAAPRPRYPSPVPPVKVYVQHFSEEQIAAFNSALSGPAPEAPHAE